MQIAVIGASGVLGRYLVPRLLERGHTVVAVARDPSRLVFPEAAGLRRIRADILEPQMLGAAVAGCDAAVHIATRVPRPGAPAQWDVNDRIRREGTANLIAACKAHGVPRYVQQAIAMIVPSPDGAWVNEESPIEAGDLQSAVDMEALVQSGGLDWRILRGGLFYGTGTGAEESWRRLARAGELLIPGDGSDYLSFIHVADYAMAMVLAIEAAEGRFIVNAVDDEPVTCGQFLRDVALASGGTPPALGGPERLESFRASNARIKGKLNWRPFFTSYRSGVLPALANP